MTVTLSHWPPTYTSAALLLSVHLLRADHSFHTVLAAGDGDGLVKQVNKKVKNTGALIALFVNDDRLKRTTIAAFSVGTLAAGNEACVAVNKAFQVRL